MDNLELVEIAWDLVVSEGGKAFFWVILGGVVMAMLSLLLIGLFGYWATKRKWPTEAPWGSWVRIVFLVFCLVVVPGSASVIGATWGLMKGVKETIDSQEVVEKAAREVLDPVVAAVYLASQEGVQDGDAGELYQRGLDFVEEGKPIELERLEFEVKRMVKEDAEEVKEYLSSSQEEGLGAKSEGWPAEWLSDGKLALMNAQIDKVMDAVEKERVGGQRSYVCSDVTDVVTSNHIKPWLEEEYKKLQKGILLSLTIPLLLTILIPFALLHIAGMKLGVKQPELKEL